MTIFCSDLGTARLIDWLDLGPFDVDDYDQRRSLRKMTSRER